MVYVYGVVPRDECDAITASGLDFVEHDGMAALTKHVSGDDLHAVKALRSHWSVLQEVCEVATVVPMRFGTVLESDRAIREHLLEPNGAHLKELFDQLRGCVQMTVKGTYVEAELLREIVATSRPLAALAARVREQPDAAAYYDRIRLGEGIAAAVGARQEHDTDVAIELLGPAAVMGRAEELTGALDAFNLAFLVRRGAQRDFSQRVRKLMDAAGSQLEIRFVGPLPPYSFADAELAAGAV